MANESTELSPEELREIEAARRRLAEEDDPWAENERVAKQRIRDAAKRPLGENLMAALDLCNVAIQLRDSMRRNLAEKKSV